MQISLKKFISSIALITCLIMLLGVVLNTQKTDTGKTVVILGFVVISFIALINIISDVRLISMNKFHWYFQFIFMGLAPLCNYLSSYYPWRVYISDSDIAGAQLLVILFNVIYIFVYRRKNKYKTSINITLNNYLTTERSYIKGYTVFFLSIGIITFAILIILMGGISNLFFRTENEFELENSTLTFVVRKFLTAMPAMLCIVFILINKSKKSVWLNLLILLFAVLSLISNFPTSTTRYWMGTILLGLFIAYFFKRKESRIIDYGILGIMLIGFPLLYVFKNTNYDITNMFSSGLEYNGIVESFNTIDFDAFSMIARSIRYVRENDFTYGEQLLNIIFFFIPRSIWATKPITTNVLVASATGNVYTNLSCPLPAEGYVNFGVFGVALYSYVSAKISSFLDYMYWEKSVDTNVNIINSIYPFLCVISLYISRGPLQPSFIQTVALLLPLIFINLVFAKKSKFKKSNINTCV